MKLLFENNKYICQSRFEEKEIPKEAGFSWDKTLKCWWTSDPDKALILIQFADENCKKQLEIWNEQKKISIEASRAMDADMDIPKPDGLDYFPFQKAGINYAMQHPNCIIADEMGLGKTIQAIGIINLNHPAKIIIVCPASLKLNWRNELQKWLTHKYRIAVINSGDPYGILSAAEILIFNYDILVKYIEAINQMEWDLAIFDESHKLKNPKSNRSKAGLSIKSKQRLFLTGTPILNRTVELFPILKSIDPQRWGNWYKYVSRYCNGHHNRWGMDVSGASNLEELQEKLRSTCMVRRLKKDVLTELPAKTRQIIALSPNGATSLIQKENQMYDKYEGLQSRIGQLNKEDSGYKQAVESLRNQIMVAFSEISKLRHQTALAKLPVAIEYIENALEETDKLVVFAHHHDVISGIKNKFPDISVCLTGEMNINDRQNSVDKFQNDEKVKLFIGSIQAAGVGITLTAASNVIFVELDWVPGNMSQAEDRSHRIGQIESVMIQHLVLDGSLDSKIAKILIEKQEIIDKALDNKTN